jgi:hypothetical protein
MVVFFTCWGLAAIGLWPIALMFGLNCAADPLPSWRELVRSHPRRKLRVNAEETVDERFWWGNGRSTQSRTAQAQRGHSSQDVGQRLRRNPGFM